MIVIKARNVQQALPTALDALRGSGVRRESRNGPVIMFPEPVTTVYARPAERVLYWAERDANPFFHLIESLWMLDGRNDVESVARYVENMRNYSDDGVTFHGAYGFRWRRHFFEDQLPKIIRALQANPDDRRQVLSMWDAEADLGRQGKDLPCNLQAVFQIACDGRLDMTVTNRSNDIIWGAYGANAVHFSYLHEFVARAVGVEQGVYRQVSANFHAYVSVLEKVQDLADAVDPLLPADLRWLGKDPYASGEVEPYPLMSTPWEEWLAELNMFMSEPDAVGFRDPFFRRVAIPMARAHARFRQRTDPARFERAREELENVAASDWKMAARQWINRREAAYNERKARAQDDGVAYE
ncbi:MAG: thymidylate synthase [Candidatus Kapaibacterium sp.]